MRFVDGKTVVKRELRRGFSTGTAATAAAVAAVRLRLTGENPHVIAVRLPSGCFLPVPVLDSRLDGEDAWAGVVKDGGDDPDVTHRAELRAKVRFIHLPCVPHAPTPAAKQECASSPRVHDGSGTAQSPWPAPSRVPVLRPVLSDPRPLTPDFARRGICLVGGEGVGVATKPGLPVRVGEPAINPVPRQMLSRNVTEELMRRGIPNAFTEKRGGTWKIPAKPHVFLPFDGAPESLNGLLLEIEILAPRGRDLAQRTLNPRLGVLGGLSILGTSGIVKPFSHEAYEETIQAALSVAASNGCRTVVLSTGGKSERFAQSTMPDWPPEAFVQVADFYEFSVLESVRLGFTGIVHSAFFGKVVKMAQGHPYTHAHRVSMDLSLVSRLAGEQGMDKAFCRDLAAANTARHALELLMARQGVRVIHAVARLALEQSLRIAGDGMAVRLLLFDYDGTLLVDVTG